MSKLIYIVINAQVDDWYHIDSVWTSEKKAKNKRNELNKKLTENPVNGIGLYTIEQKFIST